MLCPVCFVKVQHSSVVLCQGLVQWSHVESRYSRVMLSLFCDVVSRYSTIMLCGAVIRVKSYGEDVYCCMMQSTTKNSNGTV